jgi:hypothetical protein
MATTGFRSDETPTIRGLICMGVSQTMCDEEAERLPGIFAKVGEAFADLHGRFGLTVLGTFDDDQIMVGPSAQWPWTAYILVDAPDYGSIVRACNVVREVHVGPYRLWRYLKIEARIGRRLVFVDE